MTAGLLVPSEGKVRCPACMGRGIKCDSTRQPVVKFTGMPDPCNLCHDAIGTDAQGYTLVSQELADEWLFDHRAKETVMISADFADFEYKPRQTAKDRERAALIQTEHAVDYAWWQQQKRVGLHITRWDFNRQRFVCIQGDHTAAQFEPCPNAKHLPYAGGCRCGASYQQPQPRYETFTDRFGSVSGRYVDRFEPCPWSRP